MLVPHRYHQNSVSHWFLMSLKWLILPVSLTWSLCWGILRLITRINNSYDKARKPRPRSSRHPGGPRQQPCSVTGCTCWLLNLFSAGCCRQMELYTLEDVLWLMFCWIRERKNNLGDLKIFYISFNIGHISSQTQILCVFCISWDKRVDISMFYE